MGSIVIDASFALIIWHRRKTYLFPESATVKRKHKVGLEGQLSASSQIWDNISHSCHSIDSGQSGMLFEYLQERSYPSQKLKILHFNAIAAVHNFVCIIA